MEDNDKKDPMYPDTDANNEGDIIEGHVSATEDTTESTTESVADSIAKELGGGDKKNEVTSDVVKPSTALPFDFSKLDKGQLQTLKGMLDATPEARIRKVLNPIVRLRQIEGNIVEDFKKAINALVADPENQRQVFRHVIPVKFFGSKDYTNMPYDEFINAEQVECEVVSQRKEIKEVIIGVVFSRERGREVEAIEKKTIKWYTVKLPNGEKAELSSKVVNG